MCLVLPAPETGADVDGSSAVTATDPAIERKGWMMVDYGDSNV